MSPFVKWANAGHLITLSNIQPDNNYFLELRYRNQSETNLIEIMEMFIENRSRYNFADTVERLSEAVTGASWKISHYGM